MSKLPINMTTIFFDNCTTCTLSKEFLEKFCTPPSEIEIESKENLCLILSILAGVSVNKGVFDYSADLNTHLSASDLLYICKFKSRLSASDLVDIYKFNSHPPDHKVYQLGNPKLISEISKFCPKPHGVKSMHKKDKQSESITPSYDNFFKNINSMLKGWDFSIQDIPSGICLAGGSIITALLNLDPQRHQDLDLWVYGEPGTHRQNFIDAVNFLTMSGNVVCAVNKSVCTFVKPGAHHNIQLIYTEHKTPRDIVSKFDFPYLLNYYIGGSSNLFIDPISRKILKSKHFSLAFDNILFPRLVKTLSYGLVITNMSILRPNIPDDYPLLRDIDNVNDRVFEACKSLLEEWKQLPEWLAAENKYLCCGPDISKNRAEFMVSKILPNEFVTSSAQDIIDKFSYYVFTLELYSQQISCTEDLSSPNSCKPKHKKRSDRFYYVTGYDFEVIEPLKLHCINKYAHRNLKFCELSPKNRERVEFEFDLSNNPGAVKIIDTHNAKIISEVGLSGKLYKYTKLIQARVSTTGITGKFYTGESYKVTLSPKHIIVTNQIYVTYNAVISNK